ncbi:putative hemoglobin and hemoglobin-haptoglobin-binding protein 3 precursor, partial [Haemophilus influenzae]
MQAQPML